MSDSMINAIGVIIAFVSLMFEILVFIFIDRKFGLIKAFKRLFIKECQIDLSNPFDYNDRNINAIKKCYMYEGDYNIAELELNFEGCEKIPDGNRYAGVAFKDFEEYNWKKFLKNDYSLFFDMELDSDSDEPVYYQVEVNTVQQDRKNVSKMMKINGKSETQIIPIKSISSNLKLWKNIGEICIVFLPTYSDYKGKVIIKNMVIKKG